ncbi:hypothetical protein [Amphibiibacter pelophylacis]|uniref:Uncharacterized protein n=1 Tax=Amphibiibacter pelophylacis TaxID=1799477 RepID=A0ACC6P3I5_9BURK
MNFDLSFKNIAEWIALGHSISIQTEINGLCCVIASDESNMPVALIHKGKSLHKTLERLDRGIASYMEDGEFIDEING